MVVFCFALMTELSILSIYVQEDRNAADDYEMTCKGYSELSVYGGAQEACFFLC